MKSKMIAVAPAGVLLALLIASGGCKSSPTTPYDTENPLMELSQTLETENFIFHYTPGDFVQAERSEAFHRWAVAFLGVTCPKKIDYFKFKDREQYYGLLQAVSTGFADPGAFQVFTYQSWMNHECFHLYSMLFGRPSTFFTEGIATAFQIDPYDNDFEPREKSGAKLYDVVRGLKAQGRLLPLDGIVASEGWRVSDYTVTYPEAGSFVRYVCDVYGIERMKEVFRRIASADSLDAIKAKFMEIYGLTLNQAEAAWLAFLN